MPALSPGELELRPKVNGRMPKFEFNDTIGDQRDSWFASDNVSHNKFEGVKKKAPIVGKAMGLGFDPSRYKGKDFGPKELKKVANKVTKLSGGDEKGKEHNSDDDEIDGVLHGVVEDMGLSRTNIANNDRRSVRSGDEESKKARKKRKQQEVRKQNETVERGSVEVNPTEEETRRKKGKKGYWGELSSQPVEVVDGEVVKKKRKKTRSKQKNIRKDHRPDDEKPNYRPLTAQTLSKKAQ